VKEDKEEDVAIAELADQSATSYAVYASMCACVGLCARVCVFACVCEKNILIKPFDASIYRPYNFYYTHLLTYTSHKPVYAKPAIHDSI